MTKDIIGKKFGMLTVLEDSGKRNNSRHIIYTCQCDCGNITEVITSNLKVAKSCGCLKSIDLVAKKFGMLTILKDSGKREKHRGIIYTCQCDCGNVKDISKSSIVKGKAKSCGCLNSLVGNRYGRLVVLKDSGNRTNSGNVKYTCQCDCGNVKDISKEHLRRGSTKSCGCLRKEKYVKK